MSATRVAPREAAVGCPCTGATLDRLVQPAILATLAEGPLHGYGLTERIGAMPGFAGSKPDVSGVYRSLKAMERSGLVISGWDLSQTGPAKKSYRVTPAGERRLRRWVETLEEYREAIAALLKTAQRPQPNLLAAPAGPQFDREEPVSERRHRAASPAGCSASDKLRQMPGLRKHRPHPVPQVLRRVSRHVPPGAVWLRRGSYAVLTGSQSGLWQVAVVWGLAIMLAIYVTGAVSGAHINPAMTLAFATRGRFPWPLVPSYIVSQLVGAFAAAATLFVLFGPFLAAREHEKHVVRGQPGSQITAMCYGEYFPSPGPLANSPGPYSEEAQKQLNGLVSERMACFAEALGTLILALVVFAVTDPRNAAGPGGRLAPVFIGLTVSALISVIAPLTQACFNPARDFGPRLFAYFAGWGAIAIPGPTPTAFFTVYIAAPVVGAVMGGAVYDLCVRPALRVPSANVQNAEP